MLSTLFKKLLFLPRVIVLFLIRVYQKTFSPDHGVSKHNFPFGFCRYTPSCSMYAYDAVKKYGVIVGGLLAFWRVLKCNPFSKGGYDPLK